jgi:hypothetical protein
MNQSEKIIDANTELKYTSNVKYWSEESIILGVIAKKLGKNGIFEIELKREDFPNSVNIVIKDGKALVYAE